jgi:putative NADH-flavin reductase
VGATGGTGSHFVKLALAQVLEVQAIVRNVSKLPEDVRNNSDFHFVEGDMLDPSVQEKAVAGVDSVIVMTGNKELSAQPGGFMLPFIKDLVSGMHAAYMMIYKYTLPVWNLDRITAVACDLLAVVSTSIKL